MVGPASMSAKITSRHQRHGLKLRVEVAGRDQRGDRFRETTETLNVSGGGLCFASGRNLPIGTRVELVVAIPPKLRAKFGGGATYRVRALVCRLEPPRGGGEYRVGVRFLGPL
jgi:hypothetical protein